MDTSLAALSNLTTLGETLSDLIEELPFSAHLRDIKTDKYLLSNQYQASYNGFEPDGTKIIGLTNADLQTQWSLKTSHLIPYKGHQAEFREFFDKLNKKVQLNKKAISYRERFIQGGTGYVYFGESKKIPIFGIERKVIAIMTLSREVTREVNLFNLYYSYKSYYHKKLAIQQFLRYLEIDTSFNEEPTEAQVLTLISMRENSNAKYVAQLLNIQPSTAEVHIRRLRSKVKHRDLPALLRSMRNDHGNALY